MPYSDQETLEVKGATSLGLGLLFFATVIGGLLLPPPTAEAGEPLRVAASIYPLYDMARAVGGDRVEVNLLLPPGADSHSWEPRVSDMISLRKADVVLLVGEGMEPCATDFLGGTGRMTQHVIKATSGAPLLRPDSARDPRANTRDSPAAGDDATGPGERARRHMEDHQGHEHGHDGVDPHIWLDFAWDQTLVRRLVEAFRAVDPEGATLYRDNGQDYIRKLKGLDQDYRKALAQCANRTLVIGGHAAFGYLARAYDLHQVAAYGVSPDAQPTPKRLAELTDLVRRERIQAIFFDQAVSNRVARTLARETGVRTFVLSPGATLTRKDLANRLTFLDLMRRNLDQLVKGLGCEAETSIPP